MVRYDMVWYGLKEGALDWKSREGFYLDTASF